MEVGAAAALYHIDAINKYEFAKKLGMADTNIPGCDSLFHLTQRYIRNILTDNPGWLLIFDSVDEPEMVEELKKLEDRMLPAVGGHVLVTSRNPSWENVVYLSPFESDVAIQYLTSFRSPDNNRDTKAVVSLVNLLGCLPLALSQAGHYMAITGETLSGYMTLFENRYKMLSQYEQDPKYSRNTTVDSTLWLPMEKVKKLNNKAYRLAQEIAFLGGVIHPSLSDSDLHEILKAYGIIQINNNGEYEMNNMQSMSIKSRLTAREKETMKSNTKGEPQNE